MEKVLKEGRIMPMVTLKPKNYGVEEHLVKAIGGGLREQLQMEISRVLNVPVSDVLSNLEPSPRDADPQLADVLIYIETNPGEVEKNANTLCKELQRLLKRYGFSNVEIWVRFIAGAWCLYNILGIVDSFDHPGSVGNIR